MTRKCALCKGTNYKRKYSFFSAPKDPEIRKKWQDVIPIENYIVTDDTHVCSKHFRASDIVTHWVSGVPPNVIRIKYKKCRLRNGAVPTLYIGGDNDHSENLPLEESIADHISYLIPRESDAEQSSHASNKATESIITFARYNVEDERKTYFNKSERIASDDGSNTYVLIKEDTESFLESLTGDGEYISTGNRCARKHRQKRKEETQGPTTTTKCDHIENRLDNRDEEFPAAERSGEIYSEVKFCDLKSEVEIFGEDLRTEESDPLQLSTECYGNGEDGNLESNQRLRRNVDEGDNRGKGSRESASCDTMLFEDLLEIYTEVTLPRGWTFLVTSKGHATTVVYLSMSMPPNHVPVVEKEVYVKSDMVMHCAIGSREISPFHHNLLKDGRNVQVHALSDIEELVDELDQRHVCEGNENCERSGGPNVKNIEEYGETRVAYVDGGKWRHARCPLIINNGSSKCSKCLSLNGIFLRKRNKMSNNCSCKTVSEVEKMMSLLKKLTRRSRRLEEMRLGFQTKLKLFLNNSEKTIKSLIGSSKMPDIQKLMIKECLKASVVDNKKNVRYSETWTFLCLLLYVESPRIYKYMSVNNYMALPPVLTIRKYLIQIKSNPQFYSLFQRSVEPYQPSLNK